MLLSVSLIAAGMMATAFIILLICTAITSRRPLRPSDYTRVSDEDDIISDSDRLAA